MNIKLLKALDVLSGAGDHEIRHELADSTSDASKLLAMVERQARNALYVDWRSLDPKNEEWQEVVDEIEKIRSLQPGNGHDAERQGTDPAPVCRSSARESHTFPDKLFAGHKRGRRQPIRRGFLPRLEALEARQAPATVQTFDGGGSPYVLHAYGAPPPDDTVAGPTGRPSKSPRLFVEELEPRIVLSGRDFVLASANRYATSSDNADLGHPIVPLYTDYFAGGAYGDIDSKVGVTLDGNDPLAAVGPSSFSVSWDGSGANGYFQFGIGHDVANRPRDIPDFGSAQTVRFMAQGDSAGRQVQVNVFQQTASAPFFNPVPIASQWFTLTTSFADYALGLPAGVRPQDLHAVQFLMDTAHDAGGGTVKLDDVRIDTDGFDHLRIIQSYPAPQWAPTNSPPNTPQLRDNIVYPNRSFLYDNALAVKSLIVSADSVALQTARDIADAILATAPNGLNGYANARNSGHVLLGDASVRGAFSPLKTLGDASWFGMALLDLNQITGDPQYLTRAREISDWAEANLKAGDAFKGYKGGYDENGAPFPWRATEHNIDFYKLNQMIAWYLSLQGDPAAATYAGRATYAGDFVVAMFDTGEGKLWTGTTGAMVDQINTASVPLDVQLWAFLRLAQSAQYAGARPWSQAIAWAETHLTTTDGALTGFTFSSLSTANRVWLEGVGQGAAVYRLRGDTAKFNQALQTLTQATVAGARVLAASSDSLTDSASDGLLASELFCMSRFPSPLNASCSHSRQMLYGPDSGPDSDRWLSAAVDFLAGKEVAMFSTLFTKCLWLMACLRNPATNYRRTPRCKLQVEQLEPLVLLSSVSDAAYPLLHDLATANQADFFVYQNADSGFNHGFPSGFFAGDSATNVRQDLIDMIQLTTAGVDDPASATGISSDPNSLDRGRGTLVSIGLPQVTGTEYVGVNFEDPERYGNLNADHQPVGRGYDLTGAQRLLLEARSPTPGGIDVLFGVGERNTDRTVPYHLTDTFTPIAIDLNWLRNPGTNQLSPPDLSNVHVLFTVVRNADTLSGAGIVVVDNVRFDPVPPNPTRLPNPDTQTRPSSPLANQTFGVVPAVIHALDDTDATFTGSWAAESDASSYQGNRHTVFDGGNGGSVATWSFADLAPRVYVVEATWAGASTNASNATFTLLDDTVPRDTIALDQREQLVEGTPNTSKFDGRFWKHVGEVRVESGVLRVQLSNLGVDGMVIADGVRLVPTIPPDQAIANLATTYESSLTIFALLDRGTPQDLADARQIADTFLYALANDSTGGMAQLPTAPDGSHGLRDSYSSGDLALFNSQGPGPNDAQAGQARLAGFSTDKRLVGPTGFALVLDGAFGGNDAFAIMALVAAYRKFGDVKYLDGAREIGRWIVGNLTDPAGPAFQPDPALQTFGGYFLGYPDQGVPKDRVASLIRGKSIENNGDIFAAFTMLSAAEVELGNTAEAADWTFRANVAGDFVMSLYGPGNPADPSDGHFNAGTLYDPDGPGGPLQAPSGPGLTPNGAQKQTDVVNTYPFLDSNTFTTLPLAQSPRYRNQIDWREPMRYMINTFAQEITATTGGQQTTFHGFNIVATPTRSQFRPGEPIGGLPNGIAWEFTAQAVVTMRFVDALYGEYTFGSLASFYQDQIRLAQTAAPFGDGHGLVAATVQGENDGAGGNPPLDQVLGTPFQAIAERVGLAATTWAIFADRNVNLFAPQLRLPTKTGETFVVDDWDNKVTQTDLGSNYFAGNSGATETVANTTHIDVSPVSNGSVGGSLDVSYDFTGQAPEVFAGYFASLFGLTDTLVSFNGTTFAKTPFPGYFLDTKDIYRGFGPMAGRSVEQLRFDIRLESNQDVTLKIELQDEPRSDGTHNDVFARRTLTNTGNTWQTLTFSLPGDFTDSVSGHGDPSAFDWHKVSTFAIVVERNNVAAGITNPDTAHFLVDNLTLVDSDGTYPDLAKARDPVDGSLVPFYNDAFLDHVRAMSSLYFLDFASTDPRTGGIVQDRATFADLMTVGGVGFQLSSYIVDAQQGYLTRADAAARVLNILSVLHDHPQGPDTVGTIGYQGFFYHFLGIDGLRKQNFDRPETPNPLDESKNTVELSPIDTALAIAGVVTSAEFFNGNDATETQIRNLADDIYGRVNWDFMLDHASNQFYLGWKPNEVRDDDSGAYGRFKLDDSAGLGQYASKPSGDMEVPATLDYYTDEAQLIALLAMGSPNPAHRLSRNVWDSIIRDDEGGSFVKSFGGSLFTYQFGSVWLDTQMLGTDNYQGTVTNPGSPVDFFTNTRNAILATRDYAIANPLGHATLNANRWGLSATEGPFDEYFAEAAPTAAIHPGGNEPSGGMVTGPGGPIGLEAEAGTGDGLRMDRGHASGQKTVLIHAGGTRTLAFDLADTTSYEFGVLYSNDGPTDTVEVRLDGHLVGQFQTQDTRPAGGIPGDGWDVFFSSGPINSLIVAPGHHQVTLTVLAADSYGVEIDIVNLTRKPGSRPLELGTVTNYAIGSSIVHTPSEALAALWNNAEHEDLNQDSVPELLHPRFGFADAFNVNIADVISDSSATRKRSTGAWADFTGFAIDQGPMLLLIDNALANQFLPGLFMSYPSVHSALAMLFTTKQVAPVVTSANSATFAVGAASTFTVTATGFPMPTLSENGVLPGGVSFTDNGDGTATLAGTPTAGGSFAFTISAHNAASPDAVQNFTLTVSPPTFVFSPSNLPPAQVAAPYSQTVTASGGTAPYAGFTISSGALPAGVALSSSGVLTGTATAGGNFTFTVQATDSSTGTGPYTGSRNYTLMVNPPTINLNPATLTNAQVGVSYNQTLTASGGTAPYANFTISSGALPAGVALSSGGVLSGTATAGGNFKFTVQATDSSTGAGPYSGNRNYTLTVNTPSISLSPATLTNAQVGVSYNQTLTASGGTAPYANFTVSSGALPAGVALSSGGVLSGTAATGGNFNFTVQATDSSTGAGPYTGSRNYTLTVNRTTPTAITGTTPNTAIIDNQTATPFSNVVLIDADPNETYSATVTLSAAVNGTFSNLAGGSYNAATGVYTSPSDLSLAQAQSALRGLVFTPTMGQVRFGQAVVTNFTIRVNDAGLTPNDNSTNVRTSPVSGLAAVWLTKVGTVTITGNGTHLVASAAATNVAVDTDLFAANVSVQATFTLAASGTNRAGLVARYTGGGDTNMYLAQLTGNSTSGAVAYISSNVGGAWTLLATVPGLSGTGILRFDVFGNTLKFFFNGALVASLVDNAIQGPGMAGVRGSAATFDAFSVARLFSVLSFNDNFNPVGSPNFGVNFIRPVGGASVAGSKLTASAASTNVAVYAGMFNADVSVQADVALAASGTNRAGLVARYTGVGDTNMYYANLVGTGTNAVAYISRNVGGAWTLLATVPGLSGTGTLRFDVLGNTLTLFLNDTFVASVVDNAIQGPGLTGVRGSSAATFDNFGAARLLSPPFSDNFDRPNSSDLGVHFTKKAGDLSIVGNKLATSAAAVSVAVYNGMFATDVSVQADVALAAAGTNRAGLVARYSGDGDTNMYYANLVGNSSSAVAYISRNVGGTWTLLATVSGLPGTGTLRFDVVGNALKLFLNGNLVASVIDDAIQGPGLTGIRGNNSTFDNLMCTSLTA